MIVVDLTPAGSVGVRASTGKDRAYLSRIPYLVRKGKLAVTWWTYLGDLRRDLRSRKFRWTKRVGPNLKVLHAQARWAHKGDDQEVREILACFASDKPPYGFQIEGIHFGLNVKRCLIADDTGLGKTIEAMGIMLVAMARGEVKRGLIICLAGLKMQWYEEIHDFAAEAPDVRIVHPGSKGRRKALYANPDWGVLILNPELLLHDYEEIQKIKGIDFVAIDEASMIRNPETKTAQAVKTLFAKTKYRLALTATPVETRLRDLFSVFDFVDRRVFLDEDYFNKRYVIWQTRRFTVRTKKGGRVQVVKTEPKSYKNLGEVRNKIRASYIRRRVSDVGLELPALVVQWEVLKMPPRQREIYEAIREEVKGKIKNLRGEALRQRLQGLRQACNSTRLVTKGKGLKRPGQVKVDRLKELLDTELAGEQVLVFTDYERFVRLLVRELDHFGVASYTGKMGNRERRRDMDAFRAGDKRILVMTKAGERGHNLQNAAVVINADLPWNPAAVLQRIGRVRRIKSDHQTVRMLNMVCADTIEETLIMRKIYSRLALFDKLFSDGDDGGGSELIDSMNGMDVVGLL